MKVDTIVEMENGENFYIADETVQNGVKYYFDSIGLKRKIRPVNRLDLNTSGLIVFAKNEYVQECLIRQMNSHIFKKEYIIYKENNINFP